MLILFLWCDMKTITKTILFIMSFFYCLFGQSYYSGLSAWYSPTTLSLGGGGSLLNEQEADRQNPAYLGDIKNQIVFLDIVRYPAGVSSKHLGWIVPKNRRVFSVHFRQLDYGQFDGYDEDGISTGAYRSQDSWLSGTVSFRSGIVNYGMNTGVFYSQLSTSKSILFVSTFGCMLSLEKEKVQFGISLRNYGYVLRAFSKSEEILPPSVVVSVSKQLAHLPLKINAEAKFMTDDQNIFYVSGLFTLTPSLYLTWGFNSEKFGQGTETSVTKDLITGTGIGLGFKTETYSITTGGYFYNPGNWIFGVSFGLSY